MKSNDYIQFNIPLTNELIRSGRDAHCKYTEDLPNRKKGIVSGERQEQNIN